MSLLSAEKQSGFIQKNAINLLPFRFALDIWFNRSFSSGITESKWQSHKDSVKTKELLYQFEKIHLHILIADAFAVCNELLANQEYLGEQAVP